MRRIKSVVDKESVQRRNSMIMGVVMVGILVFASLGYSLMSADGEDENVVRELGFDFVRDGGLWKVEIAGGIFGFQYLPSEVDDIDVNLTKELGEYSGEVLYFVNPNEGVGEVLNNLGRYILRYQESCLQQDSGESRVGGRGSDDLGNLTSKGSEYVCEGDLPVKDCSSNLIIFESGNETRVYGDGGCVHIVGDSIRGVDAFLYEVLNVK
ncbi:hypothetical protein KAT36_01715 [Candidatus Pacearchaeota archaeon]|nr:hypothetical protein [Candidatus Pacearchaeota archaeon]